MEEKKTNNWWNDLFETDENSRERLKWAFYGTFLCCLAAHGFAYFNMFPRHDTLSHLDHFADEWELSLGRFAQLLWGNVRGEYLTPWMSGLLTILFMTGASFLISEIFRQRKKSVIFLSAGMMSVNVTMTALHYNYIYYADTYALAAMLACFGALLLIRQPNWWRVSIAVLCLTAAMGLYQSYILVTIVLLMFAVVGHAMRERAFFKRHLRQYLTWCAALILTLILYVVIYWLTLKISGVQTKDTYNSPSALMTMRLMDLLPYIRHAYSSFVSYFLGFRQPFAWKYVATIALCAIGCWRVLAQAVRVRMTFLQIMVIAVLLVLFPGAAQVMSILSKAPTTHFLTAHALFLMYPGLLSLVFFDEDGTKSGKFDWALIQRLALVLCGCVLFAGIRSSNECYAYQKLQYDATLSHMTRIMDEINRTKGYEIEETEVVVIGDLGNAIEGVVHPAECRWLVADSDAAVTYTQSFKMLVHALGEPINILHDDPVSAGYYSNETVRSMPGYPKPGYCQMVDGRLVVKLNP